MVLESLKDSLCTLVIFTPIYLIILLNLMELVVPLPVTTVGLLDVNRHRANYCDSTVTPVKCGPFPHGCYHGDCKENGVGFNCDCHKGWMGQTCNDCCDLPCEHGSCEGSVDDMYCNCDAGYEGDFCRKEKCNKPCQNGNCTFEAGEKICDCDENFIGEFCENINPAFRPAWFAPTVGTLVTLGVILVLIGVFMPYVMWKKRALIVLRLHYYFQRYEDDDSLKFDAFISYASDCQKDLDFVREEFCPRLESLGYSVCHGERNFLPGDPIVDSICKAIQQSRRTIIILSPDYLKEAWPVFEVQMAQIESLKSAHRIIPIIYRDIGPISHPTLKNILSSLQCLQWSTNKSQGQNTKLWKKLKVLMPTLKTSSSRSTKYKSSNSTVYV